MSPSMTNTSAGGIGGGCGDRSRTLRGAGGGFGSRPMPCDTVSHGHPYGRPGKSPYTNPCDHQQKAETNSWFPSPSFSIFGGFHA